ncbi:MAG: ribonuclease HII [candidate division WOR-3 bacterium]
MRENLDPDLRPDNALLCGVDEVGRGALAGPVVAAAVVMPPGVMIEGIEDSKRLTPSRRISLDALIRCRAAALAVGAAGCTCIEQRNILGATLRAMQRAVHGLRVKPGLVLVDGNIVPELDLPCRGVVGGDRRSFSIACASIVAKVFRDRLMERLSARYPGYGLERHKGYGTPEHIRALLRLGPSPIHRRTFAPVRALLQSATS